MRPYLLAVPALVVLLGASGNTREHARARAGAKICHFTPAGPVSINVDDFKLFYGDEQQCDGKTVEITPDYGFAGFWRCDQTSYAIESGAFKVMGCSHGSVTVTVRDGGYVIQTISVYVPD
jgi:hypothetical protein